MMVNGMGEKSMSFCEYERGSVQFFCENKKKPLSARTKKKSRRPPQVSFQKWDRFVSSFRLFFVGLLLFVLPGQKKKLGLPLPPQFRQKRKVLRPTPKNTSTEEFKKSSQREQRIFLTRR